MKLVKFLFVLVLILTVVGFSPKSVEAYKFTSYTSEFSVMNVGTDTASVNLVYYKPDGTQEATASDTIPVNEGKYYFPLPVSAGFTGSVVISSNQPLAAMTNLMTADGKTRGAYVGVSSGSTTVYLPTLMTNNGAVRNDTWFSIQNAGTIDTTVSVDYSDCTTGEPTGIVIKPGASYVIDNAIETCHSTKFYSAVVTSSAQPIVVVVAQEKMNNNPVGGIMYVYNGLASGAQLLDFPIATFNNSNNQTGIQIQNTGGVSTDITIAYTPSVAGSACTETNTVAAGKSVTFGWPGWLPTAPGGYTGSTTCTRGQRFIGSAKITVNSGAVNVLSVVNQVKYFTNRAGAYSAFDSSQAAAKVNFPMILDRRDATRKIYTNVNLSNMGTGTAYYKCFFKGTGASGPGTYTAQGSITAGGVVTVTNFNVLDNNFLGAGYCQTYTDGTYVTVDPAGKLVSVVNEATSVSSIIVEDLLMIYEGAGSVP
jgi:hypothetical protein